MKIILWHSCQGSPPHRRGKEGAQLAEKTGIRITPAWAGKSSLRAFSSAASSDHPRMGGEKQVAQDVQTGFHRITPVWAGKRKLHHDQLPMLWDHPRVGGEKQTFWKALATSLGSPPRGRGKAGAALRKERLSRITPAWARKRVLSLLISPLAWDHPRTGGEKG